jgi:hypothetical protein
MTRGFIFYIRAAVYPGFLPFLSFYNEAIRKRVALFFLMCMLNLQA